MAFQGFLKQSTAVDVLIGPFLDETDGKTAEAGLTISQADVQLSKNGQTLAQKNDATACAADGSNGYYNCELDATDTNTVGQLTITVHESGALPVRLDYHVVEEAVYDAMYGSSAAGPLQPTTAGRTLNVDADGDLPWNADWDASVQSDCNAALVALELDHLVSVTCASGDPASHVADGSIIANMMTTDSGTMANWSTATDSLTAIRDRGDAAWTTATSVTVSDKTGFSLAADQSGVTIGTVTTNTDMRGTDSAATASALATAQADLDILTGTDGVTLATAQANYAPATASALATVDGMVDYIASQVAGQARDLLDPACVGSWPMDETPTAGAGAFRDISGQGQAATLVDGDASATHDTAARLTTFASGDYASVGQYAGINVSGTYAKGGVTISDTTDYYEAWPHAAAYPLTANKLVVVYRTAAGNTHGFDADGKVVMRLSTDSGATWGSEVTVVENPSVDDRNPAVIVVNDTGSNERIIVVFNTYLSEGGDSSARFVYSDNDGSTWDTATGTDLLTSDTTTSRTRGRPILLSTGDVLVPVYAASGNAIYMAASSDYGATWTERGSISASSLSQETTILECKSGGSFQGRIRAWLRGASGGYQTSVSEDYGVTWTSISTSTKLDPQLTSDNGTPVDMIRLSDDRILAVNTKVRASGYSELGNDCTLWISEQEGAPGTFRELSTLFYDKTESGYGSLVQLDNGNIGMAWCENDTTSSVFWDEINWPDATITETGVLSLDFTFQRTDATDSDDGLWGIGDAVGGDATGHTARFAADILHIGVGGVNYNCGSVVSDEKQHHLAWTVTNRHQKVYLDGELIRANRYTSWVNDGASTLFLGARTNTSGTYAASFAGSHGRWRVHDRAISAEEVKARVQDVMPTDVWSADNRQLTQTHVVQRALDTPHIYHADIVLAIDEANTKDEYTVTWYKDGERVTSGITSPTLTVTKRADGTALIDGETMTQIGSTGSYKYDESTDRTTAGESSLAIVGATIDGAARSFAAVVSRDSSA